MNNTEHLSNKTRSMGEMNEYTVGFESLGMGDVMRVGGKNASLGEMISGLSAAGVQVPGGFATTAGAFRDFLNHDRLGDRINGLLSRLDIEDVGALSEAGRTIRNWIIETPFPPALEDAISACYEHMSRDGEPAGNLGLPGVERFLLSGQSVPFLLEFGLGCRQRTLLGFPLRPLAFEVGGRLGQSILRGLQRIAFFF